MSAHTHPTTGGPDLRGVAPGGRSGAGQQARALLLKAVRMRELLLRTGRGHMAYPPMRSALDRLHTWLRTNPYPSCTTLRTLWRGPLGNDLRAVVTHDSNGQRLLADFQHLITTHP